MAERGVARILVRQLYPASAIANQILDIGSFRQGPRFHFELSKLSTCTQKIADQLSTTKPCGNPRGTTVVFILFRQLPGHAGRGGVHWRILYRLHPARGP